MKILIYILIICISLLANDGIFVAAPANNAGNVVKIKSKNKKTVKIDSVFQIESTKKTYIIYTKNNEREVSNKDILVIEPSNKTEKRHIIYPTKRSK
jgi:hypothetical protein